MPKEDMFRVFEKLQEAITQVESKGSGQGWGQKGCIQSQLYRHTEDNSFSEKSLTLAGAEMGPHLAEEVKHWIGIPCDIQKGNSDQCGGGQGLLGTL